MTGIALQARELLKTKAHAAVINIHTVKPIDRELVASMAQKTGAIVTCEEHNIIGGLGDAVSEVVCETCPVPVMRVGVEYTFGRSGKVPPLLEKYELTPAKIAAKVKAAVALKSSTANLPASRRRVRQAGCLIAADTIYYRHRAGRVPAGLLHNRRISLSSPLDGTSRGLAARPLTAGGQNNGGNFNGGNSATITKDNFDETVAGVPAETPVLVDFWAPWWSLPQARPDYRGDCCRGKRTLYSRQG